MEDFLTAFATLFFIALVIGLIVWNFSRSRAMLERWATINGYELLQAEFSWMRFGPFFWTSSKGQQIYRIEVRTRDGQLRRGWARCGSYWWGIFEDKVEARWET